MPLNLTHQCIYSADDRPCKRCSTAGKSCGPKTLARENDPNARQHHADPHKSTPGSNTGPPPAAPAAVAIGTMSSRPHSWSAHKPLLPKILEQVGVESVSQVADRLSQEIGVLYAIVAANPFFRPPSEVTRDILPRLPRLMHEGSGQEQQIPGISSLQQQQQQQPQHQGDTFLSIGQRNSRAVSLPPNPELIHSRPSTAGTGNGVDHPHHLEETNHERKGPVIELPRIKVESQQESPLEKRAPGEGLPQFQPYWYVPPPNNSPCILRRLAYLSTVCNVQWTKDSRPEKPNPPQ